MAWVRSGCYVGCYVGVEDDGVVPPHLGVELGGVWDAGQRQRIKDTRRDVVATKVLDPKQTFFLEGHRNLRLPR